MTDSSKDGNLICMKKIFFATANSRKIGEAILACKDFEINVEQVLLDIVEIQAHDPILITKHKAKEAFRQIQKPVVVTDTSWNILSLNGFPGGYMKDVAEWFSAEDFIRIVTEDREKKINFTETIAYQDANEQKIFSKTFWGVISDKPRGEGNSIEQVAQFGGYTIAERHDQGRFSHESEDYVWYEFARWFKEK